MKGDGRTGSDPREGFDAKVRFAREVEACLLDPELPPAPLLALRVRERVLRDALRHARLAQVRLLAAAAVAVVGLGTLAVAFLGAPFGEWVRRAAELPVGRFLGRALIENPFRPLSVLFRLDGVPGWTMLGVLLLLAAWLLRDLFTQPARGLTYRRHGP